MRMRRKKNIDSRINACDNIVMKKSSDIYRKPESERYDVINLIELFKNDNPLEVEIGCGKGKFIIEKAKRNKNVNYIGVEIINNVIISGAEIAKKEGLNNVKFLNVGAEILQYVLPKNSISKIYLNFSCPYPKKQYANHRLTYSYFLNIYKMLMKSDAEIVMKTDSDSLFEFSLESLVENGFTLKNVTDDLYSNLPSDNIQTEYEEKFVSQGKKIHKLEAYIKED